MRKKQYVPAGPRDFPRKTSEEEKKESVKRNKEKLYKKIHVVFLESCKTPKNINIH